MAVPASDEKDSVASFSALGYWRKAEADIQGLKFEDALIHMRPRWYLTYVPLAVLLPITISLSRLGFQRLDERN